jgi:hypothetical protein
MHPRQGDDDSDMIPDPIEPGIPVEEGGPYTPGHMTTHPGMGDYTGTGEYPDGEAHAEFSHDLGWTLRNGKNQTKDWGYPGSRWNPDLSYPD